MIKNLETNHENIANITTQGFACDIDETLSITAIPFFKEFQKIYGNPEHLTPIQMHKKYLFLEEVPYWQEEKHLSHMEKLFSNPKMYAQLKEQPGAIKELLEIIKTKPLGAYITARTTQLHEVTTLWLKNLGFPQAPILMRNNTTIFSTRDSWKAKLLKHLFPKITGIIDDDANLPLKLDPDYKGFLIMFGHHKHIQTTFEIYRATNWKEVKKILLQR